MLRSIARFGARASAWKLEKGPQVTRYTMYRRFQSFHVERQAHEKALSISHSENLCEFLGYKPEQMTPANYPDVNILSLPFADASFDCVCSDQVLEHVAGEPSQAFAETFRVLKPGGVLLHSTCFMLEVHGHPQDYWRFSAEGLRLLASRHGEVIEADGWGNPLVGTMIWAGLQYVKIPHARWHPLNWVARWKDPAWPVVVWVLARKH